LVFFFASRRRHTRSKRDWSSDVCSSDLAFSIVCAQDAQVIPSMAKVCVVPSWAIISYPELSTAFCRFSTEKVGSSYSILNFSVEIGRASCRERVQIEEIAAELQKNNARE